MKERASYIDRYISYLSNLSAQKLFGRLFVGELDVKSAATQKKKFHRSNANLYRVTITIKWFINKVQRRLNLDLANGQHNPIFDIGSCWKIGTWVQMLLQMVNRLLLWSWIGKLLSQGDCVLYCFEDKINWGAKSAWHLETKTLETREPFSETSHVFWNNEKPDRRNRGSRCLGHAISQCAINLEEYQDTISTAIGANK